MDGGLQSDWMFFIDDIEEDDWAYDWDYVESSTAKPKSVEGRATLYLTFNLTDDPLEDLRRYIASVNRDQRRNGKIRYTLSNSDDRLDIMHIKIRSSKDASIEGWITTAATSYERDPNVGHYAILTNKNMAGYKLLRYLKASSTHGYVAFIDHTNLSIPLLDGIRMQVVTGYGNEEEENNNKEFHADSLATRFTITEIETKKDIARCHLSYRDGSYDPSIGPTIEMIAVHKNYRGQGYLPLLWAWVKKFIQDNFTLECMNTASEPRHTMIKAQQLTNAIIDERTNKKGKIIKITDKDFFYQYAGFSVREQKSMQSAMFASRRPKDEEAVSYIPLLSKNIARETNSSILLPDKHMKWKRNLGSVSCHSCGKLGKKHFLCTGCELVHYCSAQCQKSDWKRRHKIWCGKTRDEVIPILIKKGHVRQDPDGNIVFLNK